MEGVPEVSRSLDRLIEISQRLDELSDDLPELADLGEELGKIADTWPTTSSDPRAEGAIPRYMAEIQQVLERAAEEILYNRYGPGNPHSPYVTFSMPNRMFAPPSQSPVDFAKITGI